MSQPFTPIVTEVTVTRTGESIYSDTATRISMDDEGAGPYVVIRQADTTDGVRLTPEEWPDVRQAIEEMMQRCQSMERTE